MPAVENHRPMRAPVVPLIVCLLVVGLVPPAASASPPDAGPSTGAVGDAGRPAATGGADGEGACTGRIEEPARGLTVVSVQGMRFGENSGKTAARIVAFGPEGEVQWVHHSGRDHGVVWSYDIDPMADGNLFVTATTSGRTLLYELNTTTGEREWVEELDMLDTHDADLLGDGRIAVANMRNYDGANDTNDDRVVVYNRTTDEVVWEWTFRSAFSPDIGGNYSEDWTHVNDVDAVGDDLLLVSPRNFDMVLLIDRETGEIRRRLGRYGRHEILREQHNPDYLRSDAGRDTFLVADSDNDRIVEYERGGERWRLSWRVGSGETLDWPRDADRLPDGNTLIGDSRNDRVIEVTPDGEVVWEVYAPWLVYDAERVRTGDGSNGPAMADVDADADGGDLSNASPPDTERLEACDDRLSAFSGGFGEVTMTPVPVTTTTRPGTTTATATATTVATGDGDEGGDGDDDVRETAAETAAPGTTRERAALAAVPLTLLAAALVAAGLVRRGRDRGRR